MNDYEHNRGDRKFYLDMVLTRSEREELLLEWDVNMSTIVASTRAATKSKFQRKRTVVNARKFSKLEEVVEVTSRRLKRALLPRRRSDDEAEKLEPTASQTFERDYSRTEETIISTLSSVDEDRQSHTHVTEPDEDIIEKLTNNTSDIPTVGIGSEGDNDNVSTSDEFTLGATTLGNTSAYSPSVIEMENFHRELELELFGDDTELPSMVGQTLEVHLDAERNSTTSNSGSGRVEDDISFAGTFHSNPQSAYLEKYRVGPVHDESRSGSYGYSDMCNTQELTCGVSATSTRTRIYQHHQRENYYHPPFTQGVSSPQIGYEQTDSPANDLHKQYNGSFESLSRYPTTQNHGMYVPQSGFDPQYTQYPRGSYEPMHSPPRNNYPRQSEMQEYAQSQFQPSNVPTASSLNAADFSFRHSDSGCHNRYAQSHFRSSRDVHFDGPQIRHMPQHGHLSANQWMEESDDQQSYYNNATVTITEGNS